MTKQITAIVVSSVSALLACAAEPTAESLKKCPNGHATLKNVPIVYGLPPLNGEKAEEWKRRHANLEFASGGCVVGPDSPNHQVICTTCRFAHSILSTRHVEDGSWTGTAPDPASFPKPLSNLVRSFPVPTKSETIEQPDYTQNLSDSLDVRFESIRYRSTKPVYALRTEINKWLAAQNIRCDFDGKTHVSTLDNAKRDIFTWRTTNLFVKVDLHYERSEKTSWINATIFNRP